MDIKYAILGFLSWQSLTGYDLKKLFVGSRFLYWSGNNNQIYRTLVELHRDGLVTSEVQPQENYPARKVYTISEKGQSELREWVLSSPELPQLRNRFLVQLAWADQLKSEELEELLAKYEYEVQMLLMMCEEEDRRGKQEPARTSREAYLWEMISENSMTFFERELAWVRRLREGLAAN